MSLHKIYEDSVSPYIKINGSIHRPIPSSLQYVKSGVHVLEGPQNINGTWTYVTGQTNHKIGTKVRAKHIIYTPYSNVDGELWVTHGTYYDQPKPLVSENCYHYGQNISLSGGTVYT